MIHSPQSPSPDRAYHDVRNWICPEIREVAQRFESQQIQALVSDFKTRLLLCVAHLPAYARPLRGIMGLVDADVVFLLHALDQLFDQFI